MEGVSGGLHIFYFPANFPTCNFFRFLVIFEVLFITFSLNCEVNGGTAESLWLRCCATNRKVAVSIPAGVIRIFH